MTIVNIEKFQLLDIKLLKKAAWNYKKEDPELTKKLVENMRKNGQVENILVREIPEDECFEIVNGNHRFDALLELGASKAVVYDLGPISLLEAQRLAVETNETKFETDQVKLSALIEEMMAGFKMDDLVSTMPYTEQQLKGFADMAKFDWSKFDQGKAPEEKPEESKGEQVPGDAADLIEVELKGELKKLWAWWQVFSGISGDAKLITGALKKLKKYETKSQEEN